MDWKVFATTFGILFLAELGDKTQLAVFSLSAQHKSPVTVFLGASLALIIVTLIGAFLGGFVSAHIPTKYVQLGAGGLFIIIGVSLVWQNIR
ncbi:MAG TPA: TMEM165/GDT1 family protein [Actinobacteria bacterium]|nr:TMEM165/GDT1 family protein [Actinomycetota bacterium]